MPEHFLHLDSTEQQEILETLAQNLGRKSNVLEKDIWVCWALNVLFSMPDSLPMAFKGGTSLSKVFGAIDRFSEDIDITIDYQSLAKYLGDDFNPFANGTSRTSIRRFGQCLQEGVIGYARDKIVPAFQKAIANEPGNVNLRIEFSGDNEEIWIDYDSVVDEKDEYLREGVKIELGGRNRIDPSSVYVVEPDIATEPEVSSLVFPSAQPVVLAAERTFWEKATLIHVECNRKSMRANAERLSRHWHDLHLLNKSPIGAAALRDIDLLKDVLRIKECFFRSGSTRYEECTLGKFKLIPDNETIAELEKDYRGMAGMLYGEGETFDQIMTSLSELEITINQAIKR